ncbi:MAG: DUF460 domain-containing protein [Saccharolobus sp.]
MRILGIDIQPMENPLAKSQPLYALTIIDENGKILEKMENVGLSKIIRLVWEYKINIIATDNIYELGETDRDIINIIKLLPSNSNIIQVTYHNGEFKQLKDLAKEIGFDIQGKLNPQKTSYLAAILALKGYGTSIKVEEKRTKIIISRGRTLGPGGMSQNRYKRYIRGVLLRVAREVKEKLDSKGFEYDMILKKSKAGIEGAVFIVYAPRERLYGLIKKMKGHDVVLDIRPIYKNKIEFKDKKSERRLIIGIDPGTEVGISILDIYGRPVLLTSKRSIDRDEIVALISKEGKPVIVATDVNPLPDTVKKIASKFNARLFIPEKNLSVEEKQKLIDEFSTLHRIKIDNPHIRDSLASAIKAYKEIESKLRQIESFISKLDIEIDENPIYDCVINGNTISECVEKEIEKHLLKNEDKIAYPQYKPNENQVRMEFRLNSLEEENRNLKMELLRYRKMVYELMSEKEILSKRIDEMRSQSNKDLERDRKIYELNLTIQNLYKLISDYEKRIKEYESQLNKLRNIIYKFDRNDVIIVRKNTKINDIIYFNGDSIFINNEKVNIEIAEYIDNEIVVLSKQVVEDLKLLTKELNIEKANNLDIKKIIEEYRNKRLKQHNFSF